MSHRILVFLCAALLSGCQMLNPGPRPSAGCAPIAEANRYVGTSTCLWGEVEFVSSFAAAGFKDDQGVLFKGTRQLVIANGLSLSNSLQGECVELYPVIEQVKGTTDQVVVSVNRPSQIRRCGK